jgi:hypothetical protein
MGTIIGRRRKDGTTGYIAQIVIKRKGRTVHREAQTFDRKQAANAWLNRRETELAQPGALERREDPTLGAVIDQYIAESEHELGRTKSQVLHAIKERDIADFRCSEITSTELVSFAQSLDVQPQTRGNYMSHLGAVFSVARPAWGYPLDKQAIEDAMVVLKKLGAIKKGNERDRRRHSTN